jgi:hypothetical protein
VPEEQTLSIRKSNEAAFANGSGASPHPVVAARDQDEERVPLLEYLKSDNGHQLANRGFDLLEGLKKATLDEQAKAKAHQAELAKLGLKHTVLIQAIGLIGVVGAIVLLSATGTLKGEAATILGAVAGYLFAQQKKSGG